MSMRKWQLPQKFLAHCVSISIRQVFPRRVQFKAWSTSHTISPAPRTSGTCHSLSSVCPTIHCIVSIHKPIILHYAITCPLSSSIIILHTTRLLHSSFRTPHTLHQPFQAGQTPLQQRPLPRVCGRLWLIRRLARKVWSR
jgi:hypothetical protein